MCMHACFNSFWSVLGGRQLGFYKSISQIVEVIPRFSKSKILSILLIQFISGLSKYFDTLKKINKKNINTKSQKINRLTLHMGRSPPTEPYMSTPNLELASPMSKQPSYTTPLHWPKTTITQ